MSRSRVQDRYDEPLEEVAEDLDLHEREELAARLALSVERVEPSPAVRERIFARIDAEEASHRERSAGRWQLAAALAAAAALGGLLTFVGLGAPLGPAEGELQVADAGPGAEDAAAAAAQVEELEELLAEQDDELAALESRLAEARDALSVLTADRLERLDLAPAAASDARVGSEVLGRVYWDWDEYSCYFVSEGLPSHGEEGAYVLWLYTDEGEILQAGRFSGGQGAGAHFFAMLPKDMGKVVRAVVTEEEAPAEEPHGPVLLEGGGAEI